MNTNSKPKNIVLYLHMHQPWRVRDNYSVFDIGARHDYFGALDKDTSENENAAILTKVAEKSYRPMLKLLDELLKQYPGFCFSLSITGTFIEQCQLWAPDLLASLKKLVKTGRVEILAETYHHSLAFFNSRAEFVREVAAHEAMVRDVLGAHPTAFRGTELAYNNDLAQWADTAGYKAVVMEGWPETLAGQSPNNAYRPIDTKNIHVLAKNYRLSDDVAFRFSEQGWREWPLTAEKYVRWLDASASDEGPLVNLFMDFETFGEHQWKETGIFDFFRQVVGIWLTDVNRGFLTVTEAAQDFTPAGIIDAKRTTTWADTERDLTAWTGNRMQAEAVRYMYALEREIIASDDTDLLADWRRLLTSDHFYYMCTKWFSDGDVHAYFSPYDSPYDAFLVFMNAMRDLRWRVMDLANKRIAGDVIQTAKITEVKAVTTRTVTRSEKVAKAVAKRKPAPKKPARRPKKAGLRMQPASRKAVRKHG